jgi:hypothetical protein
MYTVVVTRRSIRPTMPGSRAKSREPPHPHNSFISKAFESLMSPIKLSGQPAARHALQTLISSLDRSCDDISDKRPRDCIRNMSLLISSKASYLSLAKTVQGQNHHLYHTVLEMNPCTVMYLIKYQINFTYR